MLPSLLVFSYQIHKRSIDKIDTTEIQLMELNSFKEVANNIGEGCGNVPIVLVRCTVGDILYESSINQSTIMSTVRTVHGSNLWLSYLALWLKLRYYEKATEFEKKSPICIDIYSAKSNKKVLNLKFMTGFCTINSNFAQSNFLS